MLKFNVVIVTYNRLALLKECLDAVLGQTYRVHRVFVLDNCSSDETEQYLKSVTDERVFVHRTLSNLGGAGGFAEGVRMSEAGGDYDYVMLIDDDAILSKDCIEKLATAIVENPNYPAYSTVVETEGRVDVGHRQRFCPRLLARWIGVAESEYSHKYFECDVATFCGMVVKGEVVKSIGLPKAEYFIWNDDVEYSFRVGNWGRILNVNNAKLNHKTNCPTTTVKLEWKTYYGYRNYIDLTRQHLSIVATAYQILRISVYALKFWFEGARVGDANALRVCADAIIDGLKGHLGVNHKYQRGK